MKKENYCEVQFFCTEHDLKSCKFYKAGEYDDCEYMDRCYCESPEAQAHAIKEKNNLK